MTYRIYRFGDTELPDYNEESDIGLPVTRKSALDIPSGGALDLFGGSKVPPGATKLTKSCTLHATTEASLLTQYMALRALVGTREQLYRLIISDDHLEWAWARFDNLAAVRKYGQKSRLFQDVKLSFTVYSPAWYSETTHSYDWPIVGIVTANTLLTTLAESKGASVKYIDHTGNIDQPAAIFTLTAIGAITSVIINNATTGHSFSYTGTLAGGDVLVINTGAMSVEKNGVDAYSLFVPPANREDWMHIAPGENKLAINVTGGGRLALEYYAAFA